MGASVDSPERPLLRSHKALPRRGIVVPNVNVAQPVSPDQKGTVTAAPAPPLTPPGAIQENSMEEERTPRKRDASVSDSQTTGMLTPRRPSKPPTPDVTPPRTTATIRPTLNQFGYFSSSSRAESFQTACESIPSDGDMDTPVQSPPRTVSAVPQRMAPERVRHRVPFASQKVPATTELRSNPTGIEDTAPKSSPPSASQPHSETDYETGFESFDGDWVSSQNHGSPTPMPGKRRRAQTQQQKDQTSNPNGEVDADVEDTLDIVHLDASLMREKNLRDRVQNKPEIASSPSMERFRETIGWPTHDVRLQLDEPESRRLSGISSTSTVSAMIIDSPQQAQRLLRHTEKRSSLRSVSSPVPKSERLSMTSTSDSQHRLVHKAARISEQDRRSISSDVSFSTKTTTSAPHPSTEIIPVVVIPERRSSLKSGPSSQVSSQPGSQRSGRRPPPVSSDGSVNVPRQRTRTMSDAASARSRDLDSRGRPAMGRPPIPTRSSSLSAPTSRNNSRTTSLTSESLRSHTLAMDLEMKKRRDQQPVSPPRQNILGPNENLNSNGHRRTLLEAPHLPAVMVSSTEDMTTLRPPSLPYTQWSIPSSSPGPIEIHEATAVSLYPHNNRSLLLVDQQTSVETQMLRAFRRDRQDQDANPQTPDNPTHPTSALPAHSPLRNPRTPPKPPISKPLPALPLAAENSNASQENGGRLGRRWNTVRRTFGPRPRSDSFNTIARSLSVRSAKNRKAGIEMDSRLHPFWRPREFWENIPGSPKKERPINHAPLERGVINNSLGLPQARLVFDIPPPLDRRSPEMKRFFDGISTSAHYHGSRGSLVDPHTILRTGTPLYQSRYRFLSRWGLRLRPLSLRNVRARIRRMRQRREDRRQAARRASLKQRIGGPVYLASSASNGAVR
ncbi:hypothetical protein N7462_002607 [Penicillium macrosclerotiorum]|uniref:uncharacterized protein n=1 Tax=Penicillium macrosclerotiorum TaxID=303699 RepID=UPI002549BC57|nr:uncharacterized protein N7462_002607 [Penicillium macrosclerotiorum]KAJ5693184.1 hypothetical protein N7462_002607 [Penicillium macrosclerotiorum]